MKRRCYPKYGMIVGIIILFVLLFFIIGPLFSGNEYKLSQIIFYYIIFGLATILDIYVILFHLQYYYIENNYIIVKSIFREVQRLEIDKCKAHIEYLTTYKGRVGDYKYMWICIYEKDLFNKKLYRFKSGLKNSKKYKRIQIIYSDENYKIIKENIKFVYDFKF